MKNNDNKNRRLQQYLHNKQIWFHPYKITRIKSTLHRAFQLITCPRISPRDMRQLAMKLGFSFRNGFILLILLSVVTISGYFNHRAANAQNVQEGISKEIIRLHVIANSDSEEDQALKLIVKERLVDYLSPFLESTDSISQARAIIKVKQDTLQKLAVETLKEQGCDYEVTVSLGPCYFPIKVYGEYTFPSGNYEALRVQIGQAEGKNWWCVMFPPLCFVDQTYSIVDENSQTKLKTLLTQEEYNSLLSKKTPVKVKFKLIEKLKKLFQA